jgi:hypothetical protein
MAVDWVVGGVEGWLVGVMQLGSKKNELPLDLRLRFIILY